MCFPVKVSGFDSSGKPFTVNTETSDISCRGACLKALGDFLEPGKKIEVDFEGQKAWFRVQWLARNGGSNSSRAGVRCLEPGKYIWGVPPKRWEADTYDPAAPPVLVAPAQADGGASRPAIWVGGERREFPRHTCRAPGEVSIRGDSTQVPGTVTDISLGGCYIEMLSPLPVGADVDLTLRPGDATLHIVGKVRSSQNGMGMGVSFTGISAEDFEALRRFAPLAGGASAYEGSPDAAAEIATKDVASSRNGASRQAHQPASARPASSRTDLRALNPTPTEALDAIARVLFRKGIITQAEFVDELERLRTVKT